MMQEPRIRFPAIFRRRWGSRERVRRWAAPAAKPREEGRAQGRDATHEAGAPERESRLCLRSKTAETRSVWHLGYALRARTLQEGHEDPGADPHGGPLEVSSGSESRMARSMLSLHTCPLVG